MAVDSYFDSPEEYFEKRAGFLNWLGTGTKMLGEAIKSPTARKWALPIGIGVGAAGIGSAIAGATGISKALEGARAGDTLGYRVDRSLHSLYDRIKADEAFGTQFAQNLGGESAKSLIGLTHDVVSKGYQTLKDRIGLSPMRKAIFGALKKEDDILSRADDKTLLEAYHTMANVAPTLSTDKNAVKAFLTEAVTSGGGLQFQTIKGIAEAENAVNKARAGISGGRG